MNEDTGSRRDYPQEVRILEAGEREYILVGTAHISRQSADLVRQVIEEEQPEVVCVELDQQRFQALSDQRKWEALDIRTVLREKQMATLLINLLLSSYQKRLGDKLGVLPGVELLEATRTAREHDIPIALCDREVRVTLRRAWQSLSFRNKLMLLSTDFAGVLDTQEISEAQIDALKQKDVLSELLNELGRAMPPLKRVLIDERDTYLAQKIRESSGRKVVAVVGAGHLEGIAARLQENCDHDLRDLEVIPPISPAWKWIGWGVPVLIIGSIAYIGMDQGADMAGHNALFWILANGIPSGLGALLALAHPVTVISAFLAAPVTSLSPLIGAGYVSAFVQAYLRPPVVQEFHTVTDDFGKLSSWWRNKLLRILLVFILTSLGSVLGTYVGAYEILSNLF